MFVVRRADALGVGRLDRRGVEGRERGRGHGGLLCLAEYSRAQYDNRDNRKK
jgi:hypothetical protein